MTKMTFKGIFFLYISVKFPPLDRGLTTSTLSVRSEVSQLKLLFLFAKILWEHMLGKHYYTSLCVNKRGVLCVLFLSDFVGDLFSGYFHLWNWVMNDLLPSIQWHFLEKLKFGLEISSVAKQRQQRAGLVESSYLLPGNIIISATLHLSVGNEMSLTDTY